MGTSSPYGGPGGDTPLVPTWLDGGGGPPPQIPDGAPSPDGHTDPANPIPGGGSPGGPVPPRIPPGPRIPIPTPPPRRFSAARTNFSKFAASGGSDRKSLGRAISGYVTTASGGSKIAAQRMGASRSAGARLVGFLSDATSRGAQTALRSLNLEALAGRPVEEVFLGLADYVCPNDGTVDEAIARDAFLETIADLASSGITDLDAMTGDQIQTVFELYSTHAIEARICNDIGTKVVTFPTDVQAAHNVQNQLRDFIRRGVADALTRARAELDNLTPDRVFEFVGGVYESAFSILEALGAQEAEEE